MTLRAAVLVCLLAGCSANPPSLWWSEWLRTSSLPGNVARCSAVSSRGYAYVVGGEEEHDGNRMLYRLGLDNMNWEVLEKIPHGVTGDSTMVVYDDRLLYVFSEGGTRQMPVSIQMYDPESGHWTVIDDTPTIRTSASVALYQDHVYVIGGIVNDTATDTVRVYSPSTDKWSDGPTLPYPIEKAAVAVSDKLYVIGGRRLSWIGEMTSLSDPRGEWDTADPDVPAGLGTMPYPSAFVIGSYIWVLGHVLPGPDQLVFLFDLYQREWDSVRVEGLATPRNRYAGCSTTVTGNGKGNLFLFGGLTATGEPSPTGYADLLQASIYPVISRRATHNKGYYVGDTLEITITQVSPASKYTFRISSTPLCEDNAGGTIDKGWDGYMNQVKFYPTEPVDEAYLCFSAGRCPTSLRRSCSQHLHRNGLALTRSSCAGIGCCWDETHTHMPCFHKEGELPGSPKLTWLTPLLWGEPFSIVEKPNETSSPGTPLPTWSPPPGTRAPEPHRGGASDNILLILVVICILIICACGLYGLSLRKKRDRLKPDIEIGEDTPTRYTILDKLGSGGYGYVFSVMRKCDGKVFAMKYIIVESDEERRDAIAEFETMRELQGHPNIINLVDMFMSWTQNPSIADEVTPTKHPDFQDAGNLVQQTTARRYVCIIMDYHEHGDLKGYLIRKRHPVPEATIWHLAGDVTSALHYMHSQDPPVMHRDLKPENLLIENFTEVINGHQVPTVVVTDMGLARGMADQTYCQTQAGSLPYVAPECWQRRYSVKVDMWAMGCILYAACTRRVHASNTRVMFSDITKPNFAKELLEELGSLGYSRELSELVLSLLSPDPHVRPSAEDCRMYIEKQLLAKFGVKAKNVDIAGLQRDLLRKKSQERQDSPEEREMKDERNPSPPDGSTSSEASYLLQSASYGSSINEYTNVGP